MQHTHTHPQKHRAIMCCAQLGHSKFMHCFSSCAVKTLGLVGQLEKEKNPIPLKLCPKQRKTHFQLFPRVPKLSLQLHLTINVPITTMEPHFTVTLGQGKVDTHRHVPKVSMCIVPYIILFIALLF